VGVLALSAAACGGGGGSAPVAAAASARPSIEQLLQIGQAGPPVWSPDGARVGFAWGVGTERDFWVADASAEAPSVPGGAGVRQAAPLVGRSDSAVSPDWSQMAYVSKQQIWTVPLGGGRPRQLTNEAAKYSRLNWSPDSTRIAFVVERNDQDDIGIVPADGGAVTSIAATPRDEDSPIWSPSSDRLAFLRRFDNWQGYEMWVTSPDGKQQHQVVRETYDKGVEEFDFAGNRHWSPDGRLFVYLSNRTGFNHVWIVSADGGEPKELTTGSFVDYSPSWSPAGDRIVFVSSRAGDVEDRHLWTVPVAGGAPTRITGEGFCASPSWSADGKRLAFLRSSTTEPPEVVVQDASAGAAAHRLTESRPDPAITAGFVEPQAVTYASSDGMKVHGILLQPRERSGSGPALMYFHGKSGINLKGWGGLPDYAFHQYLVQQGYSIVFVNWRGTHVGYGNAYEQANYRDYGGGELDDVVAARDLLVKQAGADPRRVACWGGSYGGYMTMLAITKTPDVCSAGISLYGVSDWTTFLSQSKRKLWRMRLVAKLGDPAADRALWDRSAAIRFAVQARSPLLMIQGMDDDGVLPAQSETLYDALRAAGKTAEYVAYTGEGHGFRHTGSLRDLYERVAAFLAKYNGAGGPTTTH
ncbi:MAG TPA: S9 family peptidase, partial [Vicinamibacterales bacterium]|nr:S9 family peptidase [Vicinamibacterales bacterium]